MPRPDTDLELVAAGTAFFDAALARVRDEDLAGPSLLPGWTRAHVAAHIAYNAAGLRRLADWAATGIEQTMYPSQEGRDAEIEEGAALPAAQLREFVAETGAALAERWAQLPEEAWDATVGAAHRGEFFPESFTVWMRCRETWLHAMDLNAGDSWDDLPADLSERLHAEITGGWDSVPEVQGSIGAKLAWAAGRSDEGVRTPAGDRPAPAPRWR
ncbi:maleylpyruvate isomerase family mycothiol-dependent enzyme [Nakamurella sp. YIM 132087]|uniref:Maleylpyruvate isomerase family mycothiol-dependent enzyme n=1 Tax=Nakamurella alba TaxID=2665158 RepID=A0A7K1FT49_9ACTN|nr:maleylpyruvate isomerase N-terminal domain-containing protein [Nakamurella alba]MTD17308.1 maleylpyruvate isomerase family mycothiol-dependent enzyme [Nakamurella alba]